MFYVNREAELTVDLLSKIINSFIVDKQPKLKEYKNYYDGVQAILQKKYSDATKPCSRAVINYCRNIADSYCGYLASPGYISYSSDDDIEEIMNILRYNDYQTEDSNFLLDALVYGVASELMYLDATSQVRFRMINPVNSFAIYDDSLTGDLLYFVRMYAANPWDESNITYVDVYSDADIKHYSMEGENGQLTFIADEPHYFSQCPANVFSLPDEKSIFDCVIGLQDTANEVLNSEVDEFSAFADAYLILEGAEIDGVERDERDGLTDVERMRTSRVLNIPEGAKAYWLTKNTNDTQVENILKRIQDSIYRIAACPDFSSESFVGGVSSGIAIQYRLTGMETRAAKIAAEMKKALQRRIEIITGIATLKLGEEVFRDINIDFKRNIPEDMTNVLNAINSLQGVVSDKTLLAQVPFVDDVQAEIEAVKEQKEANMSLYSFGLNNDGFGQEQLESDN